LPAGEKEKRGKGGGYVATVYLVAEKKSPPRRKKGKKGRTLCSSVSLVIKKKENPRCTPLISGRREGVRRHHVLLHHSTIEKNKITIVSGQTSPLFLFGRKKGAPFSSALKTPGIKKTGILSY